MSSVKASNHKSLQAKGDPITLSILTSITLSILTSKRALPKARRSGARGMAKYPSMWICPPGLFWTQLFEDKLFQ